MRIGPNEALAEYYSGININGLTLDLGSIGGKAGFGIAKGLVNIKPEFNGEDWLMADLKDLSGIYLNAKIVQDRGSIEQISTGKVDVEAQKTISNGFLEEHWLNQGMAISGTKMIAVSGTRTGTDLDENGKIHLFDISNPKEVRLDYTVSSNSYTEILDKSGSPVPTEYILGTGISDVQIAGEYAYFVNNQDGDTGSGTLPGPGYVKSFSRFQIGKIYNDRENDQITRVSILDNSTTELEGAYRLEVRGKWAWVICNTERSSYVNNISRLTTVDISDPLIPSIGDTYSTLPGSKYVAMDVSDSLVAVIKTQAIAPNFIFPSGVFTVDLLVFDATDPTSISAPILQNVIFFGSYADRLLNPNSFAGVKVLGKHAYVVWHENLYIYDIQVGAASAATLASQLSLGLDSSAGNNTYGIDLEIIGTTAYVLGYDDQTDPLNPGVIIKIDVSDVSDPYIVSTSTINKLAKPSRIKYSGKYLYVISASDSSTSESGSIAVIEIDGIRSPGAHIDSIRSGNLQVDKHAVIQENLTVNGSINVGPGGVYIDAGQGLTVDGPAKILGGFDGFSRVRASNSSSQSITSSLSTTYVVDFNTVSYDSLGEFDISTNEFTALRDGWYTFEFRGRLGSSASSHIFNIGALYLKGAAFNHLIKTIQQAAAVDSLADELIKQANFYDLSVSRTIFLNAGDQAWFEIQNIAQDFSLTLINMDLQQSTVIINRIG